MSRFCNCCGSVHPEGSSGCFTVSGGPFFVPAKQALLELADELAADYRARASKDETTRVLAYVRIAQRIPEVVAILRRLAEPKTPTERLDLAIQAPLESFGDPPDEPESRIPPMEAPNRRHGPYD